MNSKQIRDTFQDFFRSKSHQIVPSAPMVVKDDPTLMFTNAGMNQFKDIFLGNSPIKYARVANSQKCLRVSGKHNDLEEVGHDTYHHTMFEMLGNWSFGDYFKKEAIEWGWELLTNVYKIPKDRLYVTVFEGSKEENLEPDNEAKQIWEKYIDKDRIIYGSRKDNFWEMGETGPCGPCSEIHADIRPDSERLKTDGKALVNTGHPQVIEIWNLVFIQFNRKADGSLEPLPAKHVDTGMGFERLCMVLQEKTSNYDTDVFQPLIKFIAELSGIKYGTSNQSDIAMRVIADHVRAISFAIADGQIPSNNKAGYVIRRILRRAVRYGYTFLKFERPFIFKLVDVLAQEMGTAYPELNKQNELIKKVIFEEESTFLKTLETGIRMLDGVVEKLSQDNNRILSGKITFELYDTYGFPLDLTQLICKEHNLEINMEEFNSEMEIQKNRSRNAATAVTDDWTVLQDTDTVEFNGYDDLKSNIKITKYRKVTQKNNTFYQLVFDKTPFYAESGGQVGDSGHIESANEKIEIFDTKKENNLIVHLSKKLPENPELNFTALVNDENRKSTECNHSATHLLHEALREVLGTHVEQKGSLVHPDYLRFDFSHFQKLTDDEINKVETIVNERIRKNIELTENRNISINEAKQMGAMALFGEKYGETVRVIRFGSSIELCGGTHVKATGSIGCFKITSEGAIAAGIRRIEAITGKKAEEFINEKFDTLKEIKNLLKNPKDIIKSIESLISENADLSKKLEQFAKQKIQQLKEELMTKVEKQGNINIIVQKVEIDSALSLKDLSLQLKGQIENLFLVIASENEGKVNIAITISENLVKEKNLNAGAIIREISKEINGGGGGQPFFATAGGTNPQGIKAALDKAGKYVH